MNPIFAQTLATPTELFTYALIMGLTAPDAARAQECADMAVHWAQGLTDAEVEACKAKAMGYIWR